MANFSATSKRKNKQPAEREKAAKLLRSLSPSQREMIRGMKFRAVSSPETTLKPKATKRESQREVPERQGRRRDTEQVVQGRQTTAGYRQIAI